MDLYHQNFLYKQAGQVKVARQSKDHLLLVILSQTRDSRDCRYS